MPWLLLALLSVLTAGGLLLGLVEAPAAADLAVHNAAGETATAGSFSASLVAVARSVGAPAVVRFAGQVDYRAPDTVQISHIQGQGVAPAVLTLTGARATAYLDPLALLDRFSAFRRHGATFTASLPVARLIPAIEARQVSGSYRVAVVVGGDRVTALTERVLLVTPAGTTLQTLRYVFHRIDGQLVVQPQPA